MFRSFNRTAFSLIRLILGDGILPSLVNSGSLSRMAIFLIWLNLTNGNFPHRAKIRRLPGWHFFLIRLNRLLLTDGILLIRLLLTDDILPQPAPSHRWHKIRLILAAGILPHPGHSLGWHFLSSGSFPRMFPERHCNRVDFRVRLIYFFYLFFSYGISAEYVLAM